MAGQSHSGDLLGPEDRQLLGTAGLRLSEADYALSIAGLGLHWNRGDPLGDTVEWRARTFVRMAARGPGERMLTNARAKWIAMFDAVRAARPYPDGGVRIAIHGWQQNNDTAIYARILQHPAVGASSVIFAIEVSGFDSRWQWPLRVGAFDDDLPLFELEKLRGQWPSSQLSDVAPVSRERSSNELLVLRGSIRDGLAKVLASPFRVRASHVLLIAPTDQPASADEANLGALMAETHCGAVSVVPAAVADIEDRINTLVREISHNTSYADAISAAFPQSQSLHFFDLRMPEVASMGGLSARLAADLKRLPEDLMMTMPDDILPLATIGISSSSSQREIAEALGARGSNIEFDRESQGATSLKAISAIAREGWRSTAERELRDPDARRYLQADLLTLNEPAGPQPATVLVIGADYRLDVLIAQRGEASIVADVPFDNSQIDWQDVVSHRLHVLFVESNQWPEPVFGTIDLPRSGPSSHCALAFRPSRAGRFCGRILVHHRGRVLQTALLEADVLDADAAESLTTSTVEAPAPRWRLRIETVVRASLVTLDERRRFDASLLFNHNAADTPTMTAAGADGGAYIRSLETVDTSIRRINTLISQVAMDQKRFASGIDSEDNTRLLCNLAKNGRWIYKNLVEDYLYRSSAAENLRKARYLQIISARADVPIPMEFVYDYPTPQVDAHVCPNARAALASGACPSSCRPDARAADAAHVCPLGFWGLSRVIERHQFNPSMHADAKILPEPIGNSTRSELSLAGAMIIGTSRKIPEDARAQFVQQVSDAWKSKGPAMPVASWQGWVDAVASEHPVLLLALPHSGGTEEEIFLEIGGSEQESIAIDRPHVSVDDNVHPIVVLFGCDIVNSAEQGAYARHVAQFRRSGSALTLATIATVLGTDATDVATTLVNELVAASGRADASFGEVLRDVKRKALIDSRMVALALVAFGDADWRLT